MTTSDLTTPDTRRSPEDLFRASHDRRAPRLEGLPTELTIELTTRCQLACVICPRETRYKDLVPNREMSWDLYERLARRYVPHLQYLSLAGGLGEPLLYSRFSDAVRLARSLNPDLWLSITTNALLPRTVRTLRPLASEFTVITISMDAVGESFDRIVGQSDAFPVFERTVREIAAIIADATSELWFNAVVTPDTIDGLHQVVQTIADWGGAYLFLNGMNHAATGRDASVYDFYVTPRYGERMRELVALGAGVGVKVEWHDMRTQRGFASCTAPWNNFYISWNGLLAACCAKPFPELLNFGHVEDGGLAERINDPGLVEFRRLAVLNESPRFCENCAAAHKPPGAATASPT